MSRHGFALLAILWVLTALTALTGAGLLVARVGSETTRNRVLLARAEWAREACAEILLARFAADTSIRALPEIALGPGAWCRASLDDPTARLNLNSADHDELARLLSSLNLPPAIADSVTELRRRETIYDPRQIPGLDSATVTRLQRLVTTRGPGAININAAPPSVLRVLPGMSEEAVVLILSRRALRPIANADELAGFLSRSSRSTLLDNYTEFVRAAVFGPPQLVATIEGGVRGTPIVAHATLTTVPVRGRLAVIRRESE